MQHVAQVEPIIKEGAARVLPGCCRGAAGALPGMLLPEALFDAIWNMVARFWHVAPQLNRRWAELGDSCQILDDLVSVVFVMQSICGSDS